MQSIFICQSLISSFLHLVIFYHLSPASSTLSDVRLSPLIQCIVDSTDSIFPVELSSEDGRKISIRAFFWYVVYRFEEELIEDACIEEPFGVQPHVVVLCPVFSSRFNIVPQLSHAHCPVVVLCLFIHPNTLSLFVNCISGCDDCRRPVDSPVLYCFYLLRAMFIWMLASGRSSQVDS